MKRLRKWLDESETSQVSLANAVKVAPSTLWEWLKGDCLPSAESLLDLSRETGLSIDELLEGCKRTGKRRGTAPRRANA